MTAPAPVPALAGPALGIDTATSAITVALALPDGATLTRTRLDARAHTEHLAPLVAGVLADAGLTPTDLTAIAVGTGPGPFTGLRVGLVTAVTLGHALAVPVHGVCSLDALAVAAARECDAPEIVVATDARRKEVYLARYAVTAAGPVRRTGPEVLRPDDVDPAVRSLPTAGRGPVLRPDLFAAPIGPLDVDAADVLAVAARAIAAGEPTPVEPLYLRRPDALTTAERAAR